MGLMPTKQLNGGTTNVTKEMLLKQLSYNFFFFLDGIFLISQFLAANRHQDTVGLLLVLI